jgi:hypothetical protein
MKDALKKVTVALPNAGNTANSNAIDLEQVAPYAVTKQFYVALSSGLATGANNKNITVVLQHSDEAAANFTNITELATKVITANTANYPAMTHDVALPPSTKRYIRASATGEANGGNAADASLTVELVF